MHHLAKLDQKYVWHPFTQMREWKRSEPIVITSAKGAILEDAYGNRYLDGNSSIWTNLHGHNHPRINKAIRQQLGRIAHSSALGFANEPASLLAEKMVKAANPNDLSRQRKQQGSNPWPLADQPAPKRAPLNKVFYSDDGSTAMEVALKQAYEYARRTGHSQKPKFLSLENAYHGDTVGAVSLGHVDLFHKAYSGLLFNSDKVMAPYCYRCPFNRAKPERADARTYRRCHWECLDKVEQRFAAQSRRGNPYTAMVVEPLIQGVAGMIPQPSGWLQGVWKIARRYNAQLIADEVMTGFGRTGRLFASHHEGVQPDFLAVAKGMTGGYLPMAATLTNEDVFNAFLGDHEEFKTFFHGHSFTGNQLGSAAALANLELLQSRHGTRQQNAVEKALAQALGTLWDIDTIGDIRQVGLVAGIELVKDWKTRERFDHRHRVGKQVCDAMAKYGVLTRPIGDVVILMPPYCTTAKQIDTMVWALRQALHEVLSS